MIPRLLTGFSARRKTIRQARHYRELIRREAQIGAALFGPVPEGRRREFFCLDRYTWIWHEEWTDNAGHSHTVTTRYDVHPSGTLKAQNGQPYRRLNRREADHFYAAVKMYNERVQAELYDKVA